ncbi:hypothetical protein [Terribacillus saccharophilus]|uniref:hypothetical protein n=1 Tax=Terribacillus saccharophilus TaxID=361277 RepID=UPI000C9B87AF|nr:hypothetical protein [Terribacillus goriensis]
MTKIQVTGISSCGNSPKSEQIRQITVDAFLQQHEQLEEKLAADCTVELAGGDVYVGHKNILSMLTPLQNVTSLHIASAFTHGKQGAVNGSFKKDTQTYSFALIFTFTSAGKNAKVQQISCYVIKERNHA